MLAVYRKFRFAMNSVCKQFPNSSATQMHKCIPLREQAKQINSSHLIQQPLSHLLPGKKLSNSDTSNTKEL